MTGKMGLLSTRFFWCLIFFPLTGSQLISWESNSIALHHSESVIFRKTKEISITKSSWRLAIVYDMTHLDTLLAKLQKDTQAIANVTVDAIKLLSPIDSDDILHEELVNSVKTLQSEVNYLESSRAVLFEEYMDYSSLQQHRLHKRALFGFVGSALKFLFGVETEDDYSGLRHSVVKLQKTQKTLLHVMETSLSVLNMTRHEVSTNRLAINKLITLQIQLASNLQRFSDYFKKQLQAIRNYAILYNKILLVIEQIKDVISVTQRQIDIFKTRLSMLSVGHLSPEIISPIHLKSVLKELRSVMPKHYDFPADIDTELWSFYRMLSCKTLLLNNTLTIIADIPILAAADKMNLYTVHNLDIPYISNSSVNLRPQLTAKYNINYPAILVNDAKTKFSPLTTIETQLCLKSEINYCIIQNPVYHTSLINDCAVAHFMLDTNKIKSSCDVTVHKSSLPLGRYLFDGLWAVATDIDIKFTVICEDTMPKQHDISIVKPLGLLQLKSGCRAFNGHMTLDSATELFSTTHQNDALVQWVGTFNVPDIKLWSPLQSFNFSQEGAMLKHLGNITSARLGQLLNTLQSASLSDYDVHEHTPLWPYLLAIALSVLVLVTVTFFIWRLKFKKQANSIKAIKMKYIKSDTKSPEADEVIPLQNDNTQEAATAISLKKDINLTHGNFTPSAPRRPTTLFYQLR